MVPKLCKIFIFCSNVKNEFVEEESTGPKVSNVSFDEELLTGSSLRHDEDDETEDDEKTSLHHGEDDKVAVSPNFQESSLRHGEDDEKTSLRHTFSDEGKECDVGQVMFRKWEVISKIGEGTSGFVYKVKNVNSSEEVALKKAKCRRASLELWREGSIMKVLNHPNIIKLIDMPTIDPLQHRVGLILEYVEAELLDSVSFSPDKVDKFLSNLL
uniref:cyclin-dependent kinase 1-like n=1 Tax=Myxine glutinosa TaxID=7769 RepID=UPI00358E649B